MAIALDNLAVRKILPQRFPLLLVDRITNLEPLKWAEGVKNISASEVWLVKSSAGDLFMPNVLLIEAMLQVAGAAMHYERAFGDEVALIAGLDNICFRKPVAPGDRLSIRAYFTRMRGRIGSIKCAARTDDEIVCSCDCTVVFPKNPIRR